MDINFFDPKYLTEAARDDSSFGLSDDNRMAYLDVILIIVMHCHIIGVVI